MRMIPDTQFERRDFLKATGAVLGGTAFSGVASAADAKTLTVLSYNDVQTAAAKDGNLPRMATLIARRRAAASGPVVVFGAGDQIGPHALSAVSQWRAPVDVLDVIGPDADTVGNHELDYGTAGFTDAAGASGFPWVATNLIYEDTGEPIEGAQRYAVVERSGVRVGVVGLVYEGLDGSVGDDLSAEGLVVRDPVETAREVETHLRNEESADVVVALVHIGTDTAEEIARATGIDVVLAGHDEVVYEPTVISGTIVSEAEARANYLSEVELTLGSDGVTDATGRLISTADVPKDPTVSEIIDDYRAEVSLDDVIATTETELDARFDTNYHEESNYGNLVTDAMAERVDADVAITNAGGIRSNATYGPGEITGGDVFNTLPFANTLVSVELTGAELVETLASQVVTMESYVGSLYGAEISQQVSGVRFEWVGHEGRELIRDVYVGGEPLDPNGTYEVAVNSYIAGGGSSYPLADKPVVEDTGELLATTVIEYLQARGTVAPTVEGRMQRVDTDFGTDPEITVDGRGRVVVQVETPADFETVADGSVELWTKGTGFVTPDRILEEDDELVVLFDDAALADLFDGEDVALDLYAGYDSSEYERVYFEHSRANADVTAAVEQRGHDRLVSAPTR